MSLSLEIFKLSGQCGFVKPKENSPSFVEAAQFCMFLSCLVKLVKLLMGFVTRGDADTGQSLQ